MKICVPLRNHAPENLKDSNLSGEGRWERQVLEASLMNSEVTDIYTDGYEWSNGQAISSKYKGRIHPDQAGDVILLAQDWQNSIKKMNFKAAICNIFCGPWLEQEQEIKECYQRYNKNIFFTVGYPILYKDERHSPSPETLSSMNPTDKYPEITSHLEKFLPKDHILILPVPGAPYITTGSHRACALRVGGYGC